MRGALLRHPVGRRAILFPMFPRPEILETKIRFIRGGVPLASARRVSRRSGTHRAQHHAGRTGPMALNWDDLKVLLAISRTGSLTAAAQLLGMDQSTAGRRLAALEADLGAILFVRSKTGLAPTEAGHAAIARAMEIEHRTLRMSEEIAGSGHEAAGLVRLYGNAWTMERVVEKALPALLARHPRLEIRTVGGPFSRSLGRGDPALALWFEIAAEPDGVRDQDRRCPLRDLRAARRRSRDARLGLLLGRRGAAPRADPLDRAHALRERVAAADGHRFLRAARGHPAPASARGCCPCAWRRAIPCWSRVTQARPTWSARCTCTPTRTPSRPRASRRRWPGCGRASQQIFLPERQALRSLAA